MGMRRRDVLMAAAAAPLAGCAAADVKGFADLAAARQAIEGLASGWRSSGAWSLAQMLDHAAQSIEFSMSGFPEMKPALFRHTVGAAAFAVFKARGAMNHSLDEPIPGAPALSAPDALPPAMERVLKALRDFEAYNGVLRPHFAYGELDKPDYTRAHLMHLANHWQEVVRA
jgi:phage gp29-like protein